MMSRRAARRIKTTAHAADIPGVLSTRATVTLAIVTGVALELGIHALSGRREAWDSDMYWTVGLPIAGAISLLLGFLARRRDWLWALAIVPAQITTMMVRSGEISMLWPLTMVLGAILSAPFAGVALVGARLRPKE